jgi:hypothetical protein
MGLLDFWKGARRGRPPKSPERETRPFPSLMQWGTTQSKRARYLYKPTPRNLRYFSRTPYARRAINAIKNPIAMLDWEVLPLDGIELNSELEKQTEVVTNCLNHPNHDDSFSTLAEQMVEDYLCGACAVEMQVSGDPLRPLWLFPADGLSFQIFPNWDGDKNSPRYAQVIGYGTAFGGNVVCELLNDELMYIRPNGSTATPFGYGFIEIAFNTINNLLGVAEFAGNVASNQRPSIMMDLGEGYTSEDLNEFRGYWMNEIEGQGKMPITAMKSSGRADEKSKRGAEILRLYPEGDSGLFFEYQRFLIRTLAAACDLSPQNFGLEADVNRNTSETAEDRDWNQAIKPVAGKLESHLTREAIHGKLGFSQLRFKFVGLDREDELVKAQIFKIRYETNSMTPDEMRSNWGEKPMESEWGDMTNADAQIAMKAVQGAGEVDDPALNGGKKPAAKAKPKKKGK